MCAWCKRGVHTCVAHRFAFHERLRERGRGERRTRVRRGALYVNRDGERERTRGRWRDTEGGGELRVNRICMETVCQWVASSCGYLTLFTSPSRRTPRLFIAILLNLHLSTLSHSISFFPLAFPLRSASPVFLTLSLSLCFAVSSRFNVAARKLLFLTGSIILPQPTR